MFLNFIAAMAVNAAKGFGSLKLLMLEIGRRRV